MPRTQESGTRGMRARDEHGRFTSGDGDRRYSPSMRGRDDDDRGRGGWFGDPRGHSKASRRGWEGSH